MEDSNSKIKNILDRFTRLLATDVISFEENKLKLEEANLRMQTANVADIEVERLGGELRDFQKVGVKFLVENKKALLADSPGLGKTIEALAALEYVGGFPALIVCPNSILLNWEREIKKWLPHRSVAIFKKGKDVDVDIVVTNYEQLKNIPPREYTTFIGDEVHHIKNRKAKRTKHIMSVVKYCEYRWLLSGTPMVNRPEELISLLSLLNVMVSFGGVPLFIKRFCDPKVKWIGKRRFVKDISGNSNLDELKLKLRRICMIAREKKDVLRELPDKQSVYLPTEINNRREYNRAKKDFISFIKDKYIYNPEDVQKALKARILVRISALRQLAVQGKLAAFTEWLEDFLTSEKKLVIFTHHKKFLYDIHSTLNKLGIGSAVFCGDSSTEEREYSVYQFQNDPSCRVFLGTIASGGEGITLTAASDIAFVEVGWKSTEIDQATDRCHRIGQKQSVTAYFFPAVNTIDDWIYKLIETKRDIVDIRIEDIIIEALR